MSALGFVLLLAAAVGPGGAIKCYSCNSEQEPRCADPFDRKQMEATECSMDIVQRAMDSVASTMRDINDRLGTQLFPHGDTTLEVPMVCQKIDLIGSDGRNHTARTCSLKHPDHGDLCQDLKSRIPQQKLAYCGVCETDGCNGAGRLHLPWLAAPLLLLPALPLHG